MSVRASSFLSLLRPKRIKELKKKYIFSPGERNIKRIDSFCFQVRPFNQITDFLAHNYNKKSKSENVSCLPTWTINITQQSIIIPKRASSVKRYLCCDALINIHEPYYLRGLKHVINYSRKSVRAFIHSKYINLSFISEKKTVNTMRSPILSGSELA